MQLENLKLLEKQELAEIMLKIKSFLDEYYKKDIIKTLHEGGRSIVIDYQLLEKYDIDLAHSLVNNPKELLPLFNSALQEILSSLAVYEKEIPQIKVRVKNLPKEYEIRISHISSMHSGKLIQTEGIIKLSSEVRSQIIRIKFKHNIPECLAEFWYPQKTFRIEKPQRCPVCGKSSGKFIILDKEFVDTQRLVIEEPPDVLEGGEQPRRISVFLREDLCEPKMKKRTTPGNRVKVVGLVTQIPLQSKETALYELVIEAVWVEPVEKSIEEIEITKEDEIKIKEIAASEDVMDLLVRSISPSIEGYEEIKKAILLQLVGGVKRVKPDGTRIRGDIHILIVGDPGTAKSQLLKYVASISPKGKYVSGKGATAVGLTASLVKDEFLKGGWALEAGALVLASGGIVCIDEFDKISKEELAALHEALAQQTITITKANIHATLKAETSVLAAANPKYGRWDKFRTIAEQIDLPPTILNRFDLIFVIIDEPNRERDKRIVDKIFSPLINPAAIEPPIPPNLLRKYIVYAKKLKPQWTEKAVEKIKEFYLKLREAYHSDDEVKAVPISARQLEALIRLAEAAAKVRLSKYVTEKDAQVAIDLLMYSLKQVGIDPETKKIDIDIISTGISTSQRSKMSIMLDIIDDLSKTFNGPIPIEEILSEAERRKVPRHKAEEILRKLIEAGDLFEPKPGFVQRVK